MSGTWPSRAGPPTLHADAFPLRHDRHHQVLEAGSDPRLIVMALNNCDRSPVAWEERVQIGEGECRRRLAA